MKRSRPIMPSHWIRASSRIMFGAQTKNPLLARMPCTAVVSFATLCYEHGRQFFHCNMSASRAVKGYFDQSDGLLRPLILTPPRTLSLSPIPKRQFGQLAVLVVPVWSQVAKGKKIRHSTNAGPHHRLEPCRRTLSHNLCTSAE